MNNEAQDNRSGLSIASLVTGILSIIPAGHSIPCGIAGIVCGAIDLNRIKAGKSGEKGRGFNITGIICGAAGIVVTIGLIILIIVTTFPW